MQAEAIIITVVTCMLPLLQAQCCVSSTFNNLLSQVLSYPVGRWSNLLHAIYLVRVDQGIQPTLGRLPGPNLSIIHLSAGCGQAAPAKSSLHPLGFAGSARSCLIRRMLPAAAISFPPKRLPGLSFLACGSAGWGATPPALRLNPEQILSAPHPGQSSFWNRPFPAPCPTKPSVGAGKRRAVWEEGIFSCRKRAELLPSLVNHTQPLHQLNFLLAPPCPPMHTPPHLSLPWNPTL